MLLLQVRKGSLHYRMSLRFVDFLIFDSNIHLINNVKSLSRKSFNMKYLKEASEILCIKITMQKKGNSLDQSRYVEKILKKYSYFN